MAQTTQTLPFIDTIHFETVQGAPTNPPFLMNPLKKINRFYLLFTATLIVLAISILGVIAYTNWVGISVSLYTANPRDQISPYETLTLAFSQAVRPADVENQLQLQPAIPGKLDWQNDHTLRFTPAKPYFGTIIVHLGPGNFGVNGDSMRADASWTLTVRQPSIVYLNAAEPKDELMVILADGGSTRQLTFTGGKVVDFDVAPSGNTVAYSIPNDQQGSDLWLVDRNGQNPRRLLACDADNCFALTWSPDGRQIAYSRQLPNSTEEDPRVSPWVIDVETGKDQPVFHDPKTIGSGALWSPDGNWLASFDEKIARIRVINLKSHQEVLLPSNSDQLGSWSPDGNSLLHPDYTTGVDPASSNLIILTNFLTLVDFKSGKATTLLKKASDENDYLYGNPVWSPNGDQIVLSMGSLRHRTPQLWVVRADKPDEAVMTAAQGYSYDYYQWNTWGTGLVIQQANRKRGYLPEIAVWYPAHGYKVVGENGISPRWLP